MVRTPDCWGRTHWQYFHAWARRYPTMPTDIDRVQALQMWDTSARALPCELCQTHFTTLMNDVNEKQERSISFAVTSRPVMETWLIAAHNDVNQRLNKPLLTSDAAAAEISKINEKEYERLTWLYILENSLAHQDDRSLLVRLIRLHAYRSPLQSVLLSLATQMDDNHETSPFDLTQAVAPKPIVAQFKQLCRLITSGSHTKDAKVIPMNTWKYALLAIFIILFVLFLLLFISKGN